ncbi:MAG: succinate dehydrogenase, cytochrome b556 subunit [Gammaproteobacteria bacterium]|jgi:succinate dehydrogenase / fumarate reductase cytochrome b subunit|nr:succinate dehydrogenase, cytochrome b556 subunit [Gammaproteobacteria bacterium]
MQEMPNQAQRPVYLDLFRIRQPVTAVLSIGHRLSGVLMVLSIPPVIWLFDRSLASAEGYRQAVALLQSLPVRLALLLLIWGFAHHFFAGIRYLLMDVDVGADIERARFSARLVFIAGLIVLLVAAVALL